MAKFGDRVRRSRIAAGLTQEQLGFACGLSKQSVSDWENGRQYPSFQAWPPLRAALGRSLDDLICGDSDAAALARAAMNLAEEQHPYSAKVPQDPAHAKDSKEMALLIRYRSLEAKRQAAWLELLKP